MFAVCLLATGVVAVNTGQDQPNQIIQKAIRHRKSLGNYHIICKVIGSSDEPNGTKLSYETDYEWYGMNGKIIQHSKNKSDKQDSDIYCTICRGCINDDRFFFRDFRHPDMPIYAGPRSRIPYPLADPIGIGYSVKSTGSLSDANLASLITSESFMPWEILKTDPDSGNVHLTRASKTSHGTTTIVIASKLNYNIIHYSFVGPDSSYSSVSHYGPGNSTFPVRVDLVRDNKTDKLTESVVITQAEFHLPDDAYRFEPAKVGLRYNSHVFLLDHPPNPTKLRYFDGEQLVAVCPNPKEYISEEEPLSAEPVDAPASWKRPALAALAGLMLLVFMYFGIRYYRARG